MKQRIANFFKADSTSGIILIACVLFSLSIANSVLGMGFKNLLDAPIGTGPLSLTTLGWINDGLMAVFFFFVGLEIKMEVTDGHLSSFKKASVPVLAAIGGAIIPALIFFLLNRGSVTALGWGIPMATDIAFALGILSLLGSRVPKALKAFLTTLAVADDLLAILVIAIFYASEIHTTYLLYGAGLLALLLLFNKFGLKHVLFYIIPGLALWYCIHHSGIHATIAGVLTAFTIPQASLKSIAHQLEKPVNFIIMPLFAIANTNIAITPEMLSNITGMLSLGIITGLVVGKPLGIVLLSRLTVALKIGELPGGMNWRSLAGLGLLAGIGFTMSIFIAVLSFGPSALSSEAKFAILIASLLSGVGGYWYLKRQLTPRST